MFSNTKDVVTVRGVPFKKHVILADVNIPYKFCIDRNRNILFFCMNADEFSDQSFHSVVLNLRTESSVIVPGIRNGFASAVDQNTGRAFLGGSDGIYSYNHIKNDVDKPALITGTDIFDMYHDKDLYYVDTFTQSLHIFQNGHTRTLPNCKGHLIQHFVLDNDGDLFFVNPTGLFFMRNGADTARLLDNGDIHYRGATVDTLGVPHFIAQDGIYAIDKRFWRPEKILTLDNGYAMAFDKKNNVVYSDSRSVIKLSPC